MNKKLSSCSVLRVLDCNILRRRPGIDIPVLFPYGSTWIAYREAEAKKKQAYHEAEAKKEGMTMEQYWNHHKDDSDDGAAGSAGAAGTRSSLTTQKGVPSKYAV